MTAFELLADWLAAVTGEQHMMPYLHKQWAELSMEASIPLSAWRKVGHTRSSG